MKTIFGLDVGCAALTSPRIAAAMIPVAAPRSRPRRVRSIGRCLVFAIDQSLDKKLLNSSRISTDAFPTLLTGARRAITQNFTAWLSLTMRFEMFPADPAPSL